MDERRGERDKPILTAAPQRDDADARLLELVRALARQAAAADHEAASAK